MGLRILFESKRRLDGEQGAITVEFAIRLPGMGSTTTVSSTTWMKVE
jgi:hypothetical protein